MKWSGSEVWVWEDGVFPQKRTRVIFTLLRKKSSIFNQTETITENVNEAEWLQITVYR